MPLKLIEPRPGKTPYYYIRGTERGQYVDETTGETSKAKATARLREKREEIERGEHQSRKALKQAPTFLSAAEAYMNAGGEDTFLGKFDTEKRMWSKGLIRHFLDAKLADIDQAAIDAAAIALYPTQTPATRNRQVYTPMSAILKHAGIEIAIKRPKGSQGKQKVTWLQPEQAFRLFDAAGFDPEFQIFLKFLCYTGCRLSDALKLTTDRLSLQDGFAYFEETKNDDPRGAHLPPELVADLAAHPMGFDRPGKVFRFRKNGRLYNLFKKAKEGAGDLPPKTTFHTFCHTWATWMRRYAKTDSRGLVGTTRWKDLKSVARYEHVVVSEESRKADLLPTPKRKKNSVHGFITSPRAEFRLRSPGNAGKKKQ